MDLEQSQVTLAERNSFMHWFYLGSIALILSWFYLLTFNPFKRQLYSANDRLRLNFTKEKRLPMIERGDEYAQNNKGDPKGA